LDKPPNARIAGRRTRTRLEPEYWSALVEIGRLEHVAVHDLCALIHGRDPQRSFASAARCFVIAYFRDAVAHGVARPTPHAAAPARPVAAAFG
jgi:predicted DNA-binding ribbon-helix-helix protein